MRRRMAGWGLAILLALSLAACSSGQGPSAPEPPPPAAGETETEPGPEPVTFAVEQADGLGWLAFHATGDLQSPTVEYRLGDKVLGSTALKARPEGGFVGSMDRPRERSEQIEIVLLSDGRVAGKAPMRYDTGVGQRWSGSFYVDPPLQVDEQSIRVKGKALAFEGDFLVEVRQNGKRLARQPEKASSGAPEFGEFEAVVKVPGGVPAGSEVWFSQVSMKDGAEIVALIAPVVASTK